MAVIKVLDCSTCHLAEQEARELFEGLHGTIYNHPDGCAAFVPVPEEDPEDIGPSLRDVFALARVQGCFYVLFDRDAPKVHGLPTFDW